MFRYTDCAMVYRTESHFFASCAVSIQFVALFAEYFIIDMHMFVVTGLFFLSLFRVNVSVCVPLLRALSVSQYSFWATHTALRCRILFSYVQMQFMWASVLRLAMNLRKWGLGSRFQGIHMQLKFFLPLFTISIPPFNYNNLNLTFIYSIYRVCFAG